MYEHSYLVGCDDVSGDPTDSLFRTKEILVTTAVLLVAALRCFITVEELYNLGNNAM
jgi:hypothetical protein